MACLELSSAGLSREGAEQLVPGVGIRVTNMRVVLIREAVAAVQELSVEGSKFECPMCFGIAFDGEDQPEWSCAVSLKVREPLAKPAGTSKEVEHRNVESSTATRFA
jgi:hypothetical protein